MEAWQKNWIVKNKFELINNIHGNCALLAKLESFDLLAKHEIQALIRTLELKGPIEQASQLLDCLQTRKNAYGLILTALVETSQSGAAEILEKGNESNIKQTKPALPQIGENFQTFKPSADSTECLQNRQNKLLLDNWKNLNDGEKLETLSSEIKAPRHYFWAEMHFRSLKGTTEFRHFVSQNIERLISTSYSGDPDTAVNLLLIIGQNCTAKTKLKGFQKLFVKIQKLNRLWSVDTLTLLYYVGETFKNLCVEDKFYEEYQQLKSQFPTIMQAIMCEKDVTIQHKYYKEFLFESRLVETDLRRTVLLWKLKNVTEQSFFFFEPVTVEGELFFTIRNSVFDKWLPVSPSFSSFKFLNVFSCFKRFKVITAPETSKVDDIRWILEPCGENYFKIKTSNDKYLYAPILYFSRDHERRWVFLWKGWQTLSDKETMWVIKTGERSRQEDNRRPYTAILERTGYEIQVRWW